MSGALGGLVRLVLGLVLLAAGLDASPAAAQPTAGDDCAIFAPLRDERDRALAARIQGGPRAVYSEAEATARGVRNWRAYLTDGLIRDQSVRALEAFCRDFPLRTEGSRLDAYVEAALHYAAIHDGGPGLMAGTRIVDWRARISDPGFAAWLAAGALPDGRNLRRLRLAGTAPMVLALLDEWRMAAPPITNPDACTDGIASAALARLGNDRAAALGVMDRLLGAPPGSAAADPVAAVSQFCRAFPLSPPAADPAAALADALLHFVRLEAGDPRALATLSSPAFGDWVAQADGSDLGAHRLLRLAGTAPVVLALLDAFPAPTPAPATLPEACRPDDAWSYYVLREDDLDALAARPERRAALGELIGQDFASQGALLRRVEAALGGLDGCNAALARAIIDEVAVVTRWGLGAEAMAAFVLELPEALRASVTPFAGLTSPTRAGLEAAIRRDLDAALAAQRRAEAARWAAVVAGRTQPRSAVPAPLDPGGSLDALILGLAPGPEAEPEPPAPDDDAAAPAAPEAPLTPVVPPAGVTLPDSERRALANSLPFDVFDAIEPMFERPFASADTLERRAAADIEAALEPRTRADFERYLTEIEPLIGPQSALTVNQALVDALTALPAVQPVAPATLDRIERLAEVAFIDERLFTAAVQHPTNVELAPVPVEELDVLIRTARRPVPAVTAPLRPFVADCGCLRPLDGVVYAFYPSWLQDPDALGTVGRIDLSLTSHLAYFAVRLSGAREVQAERLHWQEGFGGGFVAQVHRHYTEAHLAIQLDDWTEWSPAAKERAARLIAEAAAEGAARAPLGWANLLSWRVFDRFLSSRLDGVTLYFSDFAHPAAHIDGQAARRVGDVVRALRRELDPRLSINVAFDLPAERAGGADAGDPITAVFLGMADVLGVEGRIGWTREDRSRVVDMVLVFLDRPTRSSKKRLHRGIEAAFAGQVREDVLRMVVPVIPPNGHAEIHHLVPELQDGRVSLELRERAFSQLRDDFSFFNDNFRGVGFWPPPLDEQAGYADVIKAIEDAFWIRKSDDLLTAWSQAMPRVCAVVCPNRTAFRFVLAALFLAGLAVAVTSRLSCRFCTDIAERLLLLPILATAFLLTFFVVAICDPWLRTEAFELLALMVVALFAYLVVVSIARLRRDEDP
ncbi:MAG: hypothetical protein EA356_14005 [Geminicoccaceae bacterium]|nr:MAG: hypothetical protein EA356_14005 [Geminicoccaceae bacterium]